MLCAGLPFKLGGGHSLLGAEAVVYFIFYGFTVCKLPVVLKPSTIFTSLLTIYCTCEVSEAQTTQSIWQLNSFIQVKALIYFLATPINAFISGQHNFSFRPCIGAKCNNRCFVISHVLIFHC